MKRHASFQGEITEHVLKFVNIFKKYSSKNSNGQKSCNLYGNILTMGAELLHKDRYMKIFMNPLKI